MPSGGWRTSARRHGIAQSSRHLWHSRRVGVIEKLKREHLLDGFECGEEDLNRFLKRQAWNNQQAHSAQTYVLAKELSSLAAGSVIHKEATERIKKGLAGTRSL
jgi:hypothetical protein